MRQRMLCSPAAATCLFSALTIACADSSTMPAGPMVAVCHFQGSTGVQTDIPLSDLATHRAHGDYVTLKVRSTNKILHVKLVTI